MERCSWDRVLRVLEFVYLYKIYTDEREYNHVVFVLDILGLFEG